MDTPAGGASCWSELSPRPLQSRRCPLEKLKTRGASAANPRRRPGLASEGLLGKCHLQKRHPVPSQEALLTAQQVCFRQGPLKGPEEPRPPTLRGGPSPTPRGQQLPSIQARGSLEQAQLQQRDQRELRSGKAFAAPGKLLQEPRGCDVPSRGRLTREKERSNFAPGFN